MMRLQGYEVFVARSANEGLTLAKCCKPDAVMLDLRMPLASGLEFLRAVRATTGIKDVPVAVITGDYYLDEVQKEEIEALQADLVYKPLWLDEMYAVAITLIRRSPRVNLERRSTGTHNAKRISTEG
jgi:DNA-binding response OmpR family regulator